ncbi:hypothetical protein Tco_0701296 [Tanacetum coccineum]
MIHLVIHLPLEALEGRPIRPRWMFPFERFMKKLKGYVRNKAKPEGSIAEGYVAEEALTFSSHYFRDVTTKFILKPRVIRLAVDQPDFYLTSTLAYVNGVGFVVIKRVGRRTTQNRALVSPGGEDGKCLSVASRNPRVFVFVVPMTWIMRTFANKMVNQRWLDAPPAIIDLDEDDDIIDDEDPLPHDLADSDDEALVNVDDDDGVEVMSADVVRGHGGDGGDDDRKGTRKPNLGGRKAGRLHTSQETRNLGIKKITDDKGPVPIRTQFDLKPHMQIPALDESIGGHPASICKVYNTRQRLLSGIAHWVIKPETDFDVVDQEKQARAAQNRQNRGKSTVVCRQGSRSLARLRDQMMDSSATREYPSLIHTFFVTHTVNGVFTRDEDQALYEEMLWLLAGSRLQTTSRGGPVPTPKKRSWPSFERQAAMWHLRCCGSGGCGDDEPGGDEDDDEDDNN